MRFPLRRPRQVQPEPSTGRIPCDRCGARALYNVAIGATGMLAFCNHHFQRHVTTFIQRGYQWERLETK